MGDLCDLVSRPSSFQKKIREIAVIIVFEVHFNPGMTVPEKNSRNRACSPPNPHVILTRTNFLARDTTRGVNCQPKTPTDYDVKCNACLFEFYSFTEDSSFSAAAHTQFLFLPNRAHNTHSYT